MILDSKKFICILFCIMKINPRNSKKVAFYEIIESENEVYVSSMDSNKNVIKSMSFDKDIPLFGDSFN